MRGFASLVLVLTLAGRSVAQDSTVVIREQSRNGARSRDTTIVIRRDRMLQLARPVNGELRLTLERNLDAARRSGDLARRTLQAFEARPRLGINVDLNARESDKYGAFVTAVTPGGPADKGGIRSGDIITRIGGKSLTSADSIRREASQSVPGLRLIEVVARLAPGKRVEIELRRGSDTRKVTVLPADDDGMAFYAEGMANDVAPHIAGMAATTAPRWVGGSPRGSAAGGAMIAPRLGAVTFDEAPFEARLFETMARGANGNRVSLFNAFGGPLADLELAPLNDKLGSYFGVSEGVLVIDVPEKENLGLIPGDVITAIDGRKVTSPTQLTRVLRTYDPGEEFKIQITRQKRAETLTAKLP